MQNDFHQLNSNIADMIVEQQLKLGYSQAPVQLYYPLQSLNRLLGTTVSDEEMQEILLAYSKTAADGFGPVAIDRTGGMFRLSFSSAVQDRARGLIGEYGFLKELIDTIASHEATMEEVVALFRRWSPDAVVERKEGEDFDVLVYFANGNPDHYRYCLAEEGDHVSYHRFTEADYKDFYPEDGKTA